MDNIVETVVWVALVAGTAAVLLIELPRICIWCLEIVERAQNIRFHKKLLNRTPTKDERPETPDKVQIVYRDRPQ
jgi:hypothetical protein